LAAPVVEILKLAACIGNSFDLETLSLAYEKDIISTAAEFWKAMEEGFIVPLGNTYRFFHSFGNNENFILYFDPKTLTYKFSHDRVLQVIYSYISYQLKK